MADSSDRCGYRLEIGLTDEDFSSEPCDRPTWEGHDRCVWHASVEGKSAEDLASQAPGPGADLDGANLEGASLVGCEGWFERASMVGVDLTDATLNGVDFTAANLTLATLTDANAIDADFRDANLEGARLTNADLRRASLEGARLHESVLTDVHISSGTTLGDVSVYDAESVQPELTDDPPLSAAAWTYREFQQVYSAAALPTMARRSYNQEKDARRRLGWAEGDYETAIKWELSRWVMRYGSSPYRVLSISLLVIVVSALLYPLTGGIMEIQGEEAITYAVEDPGSASPLWLLEVLVRSFYFSVITFATLGYGDIQPVGTAARLLAGTETILGSLLSALLVFVLARNVTW